MMVFKTPLLDRSHSGNSMFPRISDHFLGLARAPLGVGMVHESTNEVDTRVAVLHPVQKTGGSVCEAKAAKPLEREIGDTSSTSC